MRNLLLTIVLGFAMTASLQAQLMRNLVLVSENQETFTLFVNQHQINAQALNEVRISGLDQNFYEVTIHTSLSNRILRTNLYVPPLSEIVYQFSAPTIQAPNGVFFIRALSPIEAGQSGDFQWGDGGQNEEVIQDGGGINIIINNNVDTDINTQVDIPVVEEVVVVQEVVYVDGYTGDIGCARPLTEARFQSMLATIEDQDFASSKKRVAKQIISANCMVTSHIVEILELFSFESDTLEMAKFAYDYTYDIENYYLVNNVFDFDSSVEELDIYMRTR